MPGPGPKQPATAAARNYEAWQRVFVNMDTICSNDAPDTTFKLYGHEFSLPVSSPPWAAWRCTTATTTTTSPTTT